MPPVPNAAHADIDVMPQAAEVVYKLCDNIMYMKAIQVTFDEDLLARLDRLPAVREKGRSAVLREAAAVFLTLQEAKVISDKYRAGYTPGAEDEDDFQGWADEGAWPED